MLNFAGKVIIDKMIIDVHTHIFEKVCGKSSQGLVCGIGYGCISIGGKKTNFIPPLNDRTVHTPEMLIEHMDLVGIDKSVLLQGPFYGECNNYVEDAIKKYPQRFVAAACIDPWSENAKTSFPHILDLKVFKAVKIEFSEPTGYSGIYKGATLKDKSISWLWHELEKNGFVLVLDLGSPGSVSYQTKEVRDIAERHSALKIVIAHLGQPTPVLQSDVDLYAQWKQQIELGKLPNIWFDTASLQMYFNRDGYPFTKGFQYFKNALDLIGSNKIMFGSDIPGTLLHTTYMQLVKTIELYLDEMDISVKEDIMYRNALKVYF